MFQLIVAVISIALVAALAIASIFYGGEAFTKSSEKAVVTTLVNQAQQIAGAAALYKTDVGTNVALGAIDADHALVGEYLAAAPTGTKVDTGVWSISEVTTGEAPDQVTRLYATIPFKDASEGVDAASVCAEVVKQGAGECDGTTGFRFAL